MFYTLFIMGFLLLCIHQKLLVDIGAGKYQSTGIRILIVFLVSASLTYCFSTPLPLKRIRNIRELTIVILFIGVLFYPLFSQFSYLSRSIKETKHAISKDHVSKTSKLLALLKNFPKEYEKHLEKNFDLPKSFVYLDALLKIYGLSVSPNNNVAVGKNGFYFEGWGARKVEKGIVENFDNIADYMGQIPFSDDELRQWKKTLEERKYWLRERGIEYLFVLAPTKALVYPEYLPAALQRVRKSDRLTRYEQLTKFLQNSSDINFVDVLPPLLEAKQKREYPLLFYKTDFHWNFYGAFIAYQAISEKMRNMFPQYALRQPAFSEFELSIDKHWAHHRFMNMVGLPVSLHKNEHYITMIPKPGGVYDTAQDLPPKGIYDVYPPERPVTAANGKSIDLRLILNPAAPMKSVLLLGDSFFEKCVYFFSADAQRVLNFRTIVNFPNEIFNYEKPDVVIQEILNMFILRPPPKNPPGFEISYLRGKFSDSSNNTIVHLGGDNLSQHVVKKNSGFEISLPPSPPPLVGEVRVGKLRIDAVKNEKLAFHFYDTANSKVSSIENEIKKGINQIFFELPRTSVSQISVAGKTGNLSSFVPQLIEIRSDNDSLPKE